MFKKILISVANSALIAIFLYLHRINTYFRPKLSSTISTSPKVAKGGRGKRVERRYLDAYQ